MGIEVIKQLEFNKAIQVIDCANNSVVKTYQFIGRFFRNEMLPALGRLSSNNYSYSFSCNFIASPTALLIEWFPNKNEFYQMLGISFLNKVHKHYDREVYGRYDDTIDYDNPMVFIRYDSITAFETWYILYQHEILFTWIDSVGGELLKRYGYYSDGSRCKLCIV